MVSRPKKKKKIAQESTPVTRTEREEARDKDYTPESSEKQIPTSPEVSSKKRKVSGRKKTMAKRTKYELTVRTIVASTSLPTTSAMSAGTSTVTSSIPTS